MAPTLPNQMALKRIYREIADLRKEDLGSIALGPTDDNVFVWKGTIPGPQGSCYDGGIFHVDIHLPPDYPFSAPKVNFTTRVYHMNISDRGNVCIDILKHNWSPALSLFKVMLSLSSLLTDPNPSDPLVPSIATEFVRQRSQHDTTARQWTEMYARPRAPTPPPPPVLAPARGPPPSAKSRGKLPAAVVRPRETIIVSDSDDEDAARQTRAGAKRKREARALGVDDGEAVVVEDSRERKRKATGTGGGASGSANRRPISLPMGEVIVIDD